jgi:hypothetical protein
MSQEPGHGRSRGPLIAAAAAAGALAVVALGRVREILRGRRLRLAAARAQRGAGRSRARETLPSLYDRYPNATAATRRPAGVQTVSLDKIVGTTRHPSQNTADFLPLPMLRGVNWQTRWERIRHAMDELVTLPPVLLMKVGDEYFVADGHNRVAAALANGAVAVDGDVTELVLPGVEAGPPVHAAGSALVGGREVREAGSGRYTRTAVHDHASDAMSRTEIVRATGPDARGPDDTEEPPSPS